MKGENTMAIDLKELMKRKLATKSGGARFTFESVGDQIIARYKGARTVKTEISDSSMIIDLDVLAGEKIVMGKSTAVPPGPYAVFPSSVLRGILDAEKLEVDDVVQIKLTEIIAKKNNMKLFGFDVIERSNV
jgi:hypothetical protein